MSPTAIAQAHAAGPHSAAMIAPAAAYPVAIVLVCALLKSAVQWTRLHSIVVKVVIGPVAPAIVIGTSEVVRCEPSAYVATREVPPSGSADA